MKLAVQKSQEITKFSVAVVTKQYLLPKKKIDALNFLNQNISILRQEKVIKSDKEDGQY